MAQDRIKWPMAPAAARPNSVDSLTGRNSGNNLGPGTPMLDFDQWLSDEVACAMRSRPIRQGSSPREPAQV